MCFSPEKHPALKRKFECSSPVKVNKYNLKKNDKTGEEKLIWNKRRKIEEPQESEMEFDLQPIKAETVEAKDSSAEEILCEQIKTLVNIAGRVTLNGPTETVKVKEKNLKKTRGVVHGQHWLSPPCPMGTGHNKNAVRPMLQHDKCSCQRLQWYKLLDIDQAHQSKCS